MSNKQPGHMRRFAQARTTLSTVCILFLDHSFVLGWGWGASPPTRHFAHPNGAPAMRRCSLDRAPRLPPLVFIRGMMFMYISILYSFHNCITLYFHPTCISERFRREGFEGKHHGIRYRILRNTEYFIYYTNASSVRARLVLETETGNGS